VTALSPSRRQFDSIASFVTRCTLPICCQPCATQLAAAKGKQRTAQKNASGSEHDDLMRLSADGKDSAASHCSKNAEAFALRAAFVLHPSRGIAARRSRHKTSQ